MDLSGFKFNKLLSQLLEILGLYWTSLNVVQNKFSSENWNSKWRYDSVISDGEGTVFLGWEGDFWSQVKLPHLEKTKVLLHRNIAPIHTYIIAMAKIYELKYELHPFVRFSHSDHFLFANLIKWLGGKRWANHKVVGSLRILPIMTVPVILLHHASS